MCNIFEVLRYYALVVSYRPAALSQSEMSHEAINKITKKGGRKEGRFSNKNDEIGNCTMTAAASSVEGREGGQVLNVMCTYVRSDDTWLPGIPVILIKEAKLK